MKPIHHLCGLTLALFTGMSMHAAEPARTPGFDPFTETKAEYDKRAQWMRDEKVGVFIHWNPSSLIGKEISWCREAYGAAKYDQLYKDFKGENFNADAWIKLFHDAGIRYAVVVPKHHDGFCMFDTKAPSCAEYNIMHTPFGRDYVKEMAEACHSGGVRFCLYYSVLDWWNPNYSGKPGADLTNYKNEVFKTHMRELLTKYGPAGYIWFDGCWDRSWTHKDGREMYGFIRGLQPGTLVGNRIEPRPGGVAVDTFYPGPDGVGDYQAREIGIGDYYMEKAWDKCINVSANGWAWVPPMTPRPLPELLNHMIQAIGRDGGILLGIGPRPDGTIDPATSARLLEFGEWMKTNGEAVYGTRGGPFLPGTWGVSTRKGNKVYLFVTEWRGDAVTLPALPAGVKSARMITGGEVKIEKHAKQWSVRVAAASRKPVATIVELTLDREAMTLPVIDVPEPKPLSQGKPVKVSGEWPGREKELAKEHVNDGNFDTIWAGPEGDSDGVVQIDLGAETEVASVLLDDHTYNRTRKFEVRAQVAGQWKALAAGTTIGSRKILSFPPVKARVFYLVIWEAIETPVVNEFQLFGK